MSVLKTGHLSKKKVPKISVVLGPDCTQNKKVKKRSVGNKQTKISNFKSLYRTTEDTEIPFLELLTVIENIVSRNITLVLVIKP